MELNSLFFSLTFYLPWDLVLGVSFSNHRWRGFDILSSIIFFSQSSPDSSSFFFDFHSSFSSGVIMTVFVSENPLWFSGCATVSFCGIALVLAHVSEETAALKRVQP